MDSNKIRDKMYQTIENLQRENVRLIDQRSALAYKCENLEKEYQKCSRQKYELREKLNKAQKALYDIFMNCGILEKPLHEFVEKSYEEIFGC